MRSIHLLRLRPWLQLHEAADYLESGIGFELSAISVMRLGMDKHLPLSLYLPVGTKATAYLNVAGGPEAPAGITRIEGLWTLVMDTIARQQLEHDYEFAAHRNYIDIGEISGASVKSGAYRFQLEPQKSQTGFSTRSRSAFPEGSVLAIRTTALEAFIRANRESPPEEHSAPAQEKTVLDKPLQDRERNTLLILIGALCRHAKVDYLKPSAAGAAIQAMTEELGARVSARAIEDHLRKVPDAIERRAKSSN